MPFSAIAGLGTAIIGSQQAEGKAEAATAARNAAVQQWLNIHVPDPQQQAIELQNYKVAGTLSPKYQQAFQQSQTGLKSLSVDPTSRTAEVQALTQMQDLAKNGGMDAQAKQQEQQGLNTANTNERGQRDAIVQAAAARGTGGSGAQIAAQLEASQGDANQAAATGQASAAAAQQRALQAMASSSQMGSTLNNQDYNQAASAATAQDAINRFNTQTQQSVGDANVKASNDASAANLANAQAVSNANTGVANTQETYNKGLAQKQFQDQSQIAAGVGNSEAGVATQANINATNTGNMWAGIGDAVSQGATALSNSSKDGDGTTNKDKNSSDDQGE